MKHWKRILFTYFWLFLIGSIIGFLYEGLLELLKNGTWVNRQGLIYGPFSQVYGIGFIIIYWILHKIQKISHLFIIGTITGGCIEYILSLLQEYIFGTISWDYSNYLFNINGRTSLFHALCWGLLALLFVKFIFPILIKFCKLFENKIGYFITWILLILLIIDIFISIVASIRQDQRKHHILPKYPFEKFIDYYYPDERMNQIYNNKQYRYEK